ncbi:putative late blight resistance protein R1B-16 isoform X1 [Salvia divinorum]|uniref:Late blight resistance protein R1B-16 isoform X1 n=1 Tax=Salvia divinorum TaxID=28513 RepID=A0ABD1GUS0_SALDI
MCYNLQSLITILQQILDPEQTRWIVDENKPQLQSLLDKATSLQQVLDKSPLTKIDSLESQIREAAHKAEDIIESHMVDQMLSGMNGARCTFSEPDLPKATRELDSVMERVSKLVEMEDTKMPSAGSSSSGGASFPSSKSAVVGIDEDLIQLKDRLTGMPSKLEIVPIVGMGGVGKTTLARKLYEDPYIISHFDYARAWTTISQDHNMRQILLSLLRCIIGKEPDQHNEKGDEELQIMLYKSLYGRRYLIVLDDVWSTNFWDQIRMYFPNNNNGSRIVITTRESGVAIYADSKSLQHQVQLLSKSDSWNLLHQLVFGEEDCPLEIQEVGQKIACHCGGLPLAINVIGGLLSKIERSKDVWEKIANNVIAETDKQCSGILSLSYNHLPNHLKPCFLYMGAFPEDYEIKGSRLVRMWVAEGFVRSSEKRSLEEEPEDCLKDLVERNLFLVREYKYGEPKSYNMHDMLRDLCIKKSEDERFLHVKKALTLSNPRRVSVHSSREMEDATSSAKTMSLARSFIAIGRMEVEFPRGAFFALRLLRVLDLIDTEFSEFPIEIFELVNLRFLAFYCNSSIPSGISRLWNLQTLIAHAWEFDEPFELWQLSELRNLNISGLELLRDEDMKYGVLKKLQMVSIVFLTDSVIRNGFFKRIPNIMMLGIDDFLRTSMTIDLSHLHKLEILRCTSGSFGECSHYLPRVRFPCNIRKLFLGICVINPGVLTTLCALHNLQVLKISRCKFESEEETHEEEWEAADGDEFCSLQFLYLDGLDIVRWIADETNFPRLRHLCLRSCYRLEEIPSGIGEIPTLQLIELHNCTTTLVESARQIEEVQRSDYGNYDLKLRIG